jgi:hypothetical protein
MHGPEGGGAQQCAPPTRPGAAEVYPDAHWPTQIADALRELIHQTNLVRDQGHDALDDTVRNELITRYRHGVLVGLSDTTTHGTRPGERKARLLLQVCCTTAKPTSPRSSHNATTPNIRILRLNVCAGRVSRPHRRGARAE